MDFDHRDERITITEQGNWLLNLHFSAPC